MKRSHIFQVLVATLATVLVAILLHEAHTWRGTTHPDFHIEWIGSRVASQGEAPYSDETTLSIQLGSRGHSFLLFPSWLVDLASDAKVSKL